MLFRFRLRCRSSGTRCIEILSMPQVDHGGPCVADVAWARIFSEATCAVAIGMSVSVAADASRMPVVFPEISGQLGIERRCRLLLLMHESRSALRELYSHMFCASCLEV